MLHYKPRYTIAIHRNVLYCNAMQCSIDNTSHCAALHYKPRYTIAIHRNVLHCTALHCTALHCTAVAIQTALHCTHSTF